jgi:3-deoxy-manno-octulosonate cytidylyltransferase (CMP-KDO synthetase)
MASRRFPGKPLAKILGLTMIEHVYRRSVLSGALDDVLVATCDEEIREEVERFGARAILTSDRHTRCTDRVAEAAETLPGDDVVVNIQGDEPLLDPGMVRAVAAPLTEDPGVLATTIIAPLADPSEAEDRNVVKVVTARSGDVLYFSREPIPSGKMGGEPKERLKQIGILAFRRDFLVRLAALPETPLEQIESVDLLRALENGFPVRGVLATARSFGVDTPEDLRRAEEEMRTDVLYERYAAAR